MPGHDIIVVGASAGGVEALSQLVAGLPSELSAAIFVVVHISAYSKSFLPKILSRKGKLQATHAIDGEAIANGHIYVAPPDYHLLVKPGYIRVVLGPKENNCRPAVDPLFRTAAKAYGNRVVGVILSGMLDDGTAGLMDVKRTRGVAIVQDPQEASFSGMPTSAVENVEVDYILPISSIAPVLVQLAGESVEGAICMPNENEMEPDIVELDGAALRERRKPGPPSNFTCPECGGTLFQTQGTKLIQYRCRTGHAFSSGTLLAQQSVVQEEAMWAAIRSLEERAELMNQMMSRAHEGNRPRSAKLYETQALEAQQRADLIRQALFQGQLPATMQPDATEREEEENTQSTGHSYGRTQEDLSLQSPGAQTQDISQSSLKVVVIAGADGGLRALSQILPALPLNVPAAVIVMQYLDAQSDPSLMADALNRPTTLPLKYAQAKERLQPGRIYIAPPTQHLLVNPDATLSLSEAVFVDFMRPSVDLLLQSVAATFKQRVIAVILSGTGTDGTLGVQAIHKMGGKVIAQDESTCEYFEMSNAAIETGTVDFVLPVDAIASTVANLIITDFPG